MHKSARRAWLMNNHPPSPPHSRCYSAETNSWDKICGRLIVYSCFMALCNLNTFVIRLKARWRQRLLPGESDCRKGGFIPTSGFISAVTFITPFMQSDRRRAGCYCTGATPSCPPPIFILSSLFPASTFSLFLFFFFDGANYLNFCRWVASIFLPLGWKLKVTRSDPALLMAANCHE